MINPADYPRETVEDIARLRRRIDASGIPARATDRNLIIGTWNIFRFGQVHPSFAPNPRSPKRNRRGLALVAEVVRHFDVIALQEVLRDTTGIRMLVEEYLGPDWVLILSDVTTGDAGNSERLAFIYDKRRVSPAGLAGEIVLPPVAVEVPGQTTGTTEVVMQPATQFARTPYIVGFEAGGQRFSLLTTHIKFGDSPADRLPELQALAHVTASEIRDRVHDNDQEVGSLIVLGDFNIDRRNQDPLFRAFVSTGLFVPPELFGLQTTIGADPKFFDQIAWFMGLMDLKYGGRAGVIDFKGAIFQELSNRQVPSRMSDHFPLWVEFITDRSEEVFAETLGLDPAMPDPLSTVPD